MAGQTVGLELRGFADPVRGSTMGAMDTALSDLLACPSCGPTYGLVLLPHELADGRVRRGVLGCANCRERYPIEGGVADLRTGGSGPSGGAEGPGSSSAGPAVGEEAPVRLAGLMGLAEARGTVLVAGPGAVHARGIAELVEGVEVVAVVDGEAPPPADRVSLMRVTEVLPLRSGALRGVALTGAYGALLEEGARVLGKEGRLVLDPAPSDATARLESAGLRVVAEEGGVVVAARPT